MVRDARRRRLVHEGRLARPSAPRRPRTAPGTTARRGAAAATGVGDRYVPLSRGRGRGAGPLPGLPRRRVHARRGDRPAGDRWPAACGASCSSAGSRSTRAPTVGRDRRPAAGLARRGRRRRPAGAGAARARRAGVAAGPRPDALGGRRRRGPGRRRRSSALNAWAAGWPWFGRRLVTWSSYIVLTEPIPDRLADLGWTGGEGLADGRFTLHYLRTTRDGRIALGGGGGRAGFGGRIGGDVHRRRRCRCAARPPACGGSSRRCATSASRTPGAARSTSAPTTCRGSAPVRGPADPLRPRLQRQRRRAVARRSGGSWRRGRWRRADDPALALPLADGRAAAGLPARAGAVRRGAAHPRGRRRVARRREERGEPVGPLTRELSAGCSRRLGLPPRARTEPAGRSGAAESG